MFKKFVQLSALAAAALAKENQASDHWAVIVVGSRGFSNYRHHADGCHAYQQAIQNGIPAEQVIMIAYDDVAQSESNPFKGQLFNKPTATGEEGVDVYAGCKIDYKGEEATKETLISVLKGDDIYDRVLKSDENSKVFFYFADHGAPGLVAMPVGKYLMANELNEAFEFMHENKMYKEMVVYMEACESGSMFENILKKDINIYAVSAANAKESSWGTYCYPDDKVNGKHVGSCLGDLFSINWMEDLDAAMAKKQLGTETLEAQFSSVKTKTNRSHVLQWGDTKITSEVIGEFEAGTYSVPKDMWSAFRSAGKQILNAGMGWEAAQTAQKNDLAVGVRDIDLHYKYSKVLNDPSEENQNALMAELNHRLTIDKIFENTFPQFIEETKKGDYPLPTTDKDFECYGNLIDIYTETCGQPDTYTMKYFGAFLNQCKAIKYYPAALEDFKTKLTAACKTTA